MPTSLRSRLNELEQAFAADVLGAIRNASLDELAGTSGVSRSHAPGPLPVTSAPASRGLREMGRRRGGSRLPRRSSEDIERIIESVVTLLRNTPGGLRAEEIREGLGLDAKELPRPLQDALHSGRVSKSGRKRATTYFAKGGRGGLRDGGGLRHRGGSKGRGGTVRLRGPRGGRAVRKGKRGKRRG